MNVHDPDVRQKIAEHWDAAAKGIGKRRNWRDFPLIHKWLNNKICGEPIDGVSSLGLNRIFKQQLNGRVLGRGVSVGGGSGLREIQLILGGFVEEMVVYDLSPSRIEMGKGLARKYRVEDRITFHCEDGMPSFRERYDLVFWHASLHHMFDTPKAIEASWGSLNPGGFLWGLEYTGPTKAQYTEEMLSWATAIRRMMPEQYIAKNKHFPRPVFIPVPPPRPYRLDPSEAADSERILPALKATIPHVQLWPLGGVGYVVAFNGMAPRFDPESAEDQQWIRSIMAVDDRLSEMGLNLRHAILAEK